MGDTSNHRASHSGRDGSLMQGWEQARVEDFKVRGKDYLRTKRKVRCSSCLVQLVAVDCEIVQSHTTNIASTSYGKSLLRRHGGKLNFIVQFMGHVKDEDKKTLQCSLVLWFVYKSDSQSIGSKPGGKLFEKFRNSEDSFRNSRFKVVPCIHKGSFAVKAVMGDRPCLVANSMQTHYFSNKNYMECDIDLASCSHRRIQSLISELPSMRISIAFVLQAQDEFDLPEVILGCVAFSGLDPVAMARRGTEMSHNEAHGRRPIPAILRKGVRTGEISVRAVGWFPRRLWNVLRRRVTLNYCPDNPMCEDFEHAQLYSEAEDDDKSDDTNEGDEGNNDDTEPFISADSYPVNVSGSKPVSVALIAALVFIGALTGCFGVTRALLPSKSIPKRL